MIDKIGGGGRMEAKMSTVSVAVVIPVYNGAKYLGEALESVLRQTVKPECILVIDDGSPDNSAEVARSYTGVQVLTQANAGVSASRNRGAALTSATWIAFLDQDDFWEPKKLERQIEALNRVPGSTVCVTRMKYLNQLDIPGNREYVEGERLPPAQDIGRLIYKDLRFPPSSVMVRREALLAAGGFDSEAQPCEDWDLWLRLEQAGARFVTCDEPLTIYRVHASNGSNDAYKMYRGELRVYDRRIAPRIPPALRPLHRRYASSAFLTGVALMERSLGRPHLSIMMRSLSLCPFGHWRRYKVAAHMLLTHFGLLGGGTTFKAA